MADEVSICNLALARLGQDTIININDNDRLSKICKLHFASKRDGLLRSYRWKFAIKRASLPAIATPPLFGYANAYQVPVDCLRVLSINDLDPEFDPDLDPSIWDREGLNVVTDEKAPIKIKYIAQVSDPALFDSSFENTLASYLAAFMAPSLREVESEIVATILNEFNFFLAEARRTNAIEARPRLRRLTRSSWATPPRTPRSFGV